MGYFANGTEGDVYYAKYCANCRHDNLDQDQGCPIWGLHLLWNYDQVDGPFDYAVEPMEMNEQNIMRVALDSFIPMSEDGLENLECKMFCPRPPDPAGAALPGFEDLVKPVRQPH